MTSLAIVLLLCGTTVLPALHLAFHELPHHHGGESHHHDGASHHHEGSDDHHGQPQEHAPDEHGDGSVAHFSAAIAAAAAQPYTPLLLTLICVGRVEARQQASARTTNAAANGVRGPPQLQG